LTGKEDEAINENLRKHDLITKFFQESVQNRAFNEIEDELNDLADIKPELDDLEHGITFDIDEDKVHDDQEKNENEYEYESSDSYVSEDLTDGDEGDEQVIKAQHTTIKDSVRKILKTEPKSEIIPGFEDSQSLKNQGMIKIEDLDPPIEEEKKQGKGIKKKVAIGKQKQKITDYFNKP